MWRDLLTGEAHADPYIWLVVLIAHAGLGAGLWLLASGRGTWPGVMHASVIYALVEAVQALAGGLLIWDALLDWTAATLGALFAASLHAGRLRLARCIAAALALIGLTGIIRRR